MPTHHATVKILVHFAKSVWWYLAFTGDDDTNVSYSQRVLRLDGLWTAKSDEDALWGGRTVVDIGAAAIRRGLDDLTALDETFLSFIQNPGTQHIGRYVRLALQDTWTNTNPRPASTECSSPTPEH